MNRLKYTIAVLALVLPASLVLAQNTTGVDYKRQVYDRAYTGGIVFHSRGYSLSGRYLKYIDGYNLQGLEIDLVKLRHPKEIIQSNDLYNNTRGFVLGRINSFYTLRAGYVRKKILFDKTDRGSVSISWINSGGLSLGLLKPIYLQVVVATGENGQGGIRTIRYTGEVPPLDIYGEANFFMGLDEIKLRPGIYYKTGFEFDYQLLDEKITSLEAGMIYDYFFSEVPIFYEEDGDVNWSGFFQLYISFNFGYKKN